MVLTILNLPAYYQLVAQLIISVYLKNHINKQFCNAEVKYHSYKRPPLMSHPQQLNEPAILLTNRHLAFFTILSVGPSLPFYESYFFLLDLIYKYTRKRHANFFGRQASNILQQCEILKLYLKNFR